MTEDVMLQEAIAAIRQGQRSRARDLLTRLLRASPNNPEYWLWMSSVVDSHKEQVYCLQSTLRLAPDNQKARQGLVILGALPADPSVKPVPPVSRQWEVTTIDIPKRRLWDNLFARMLILSSSAVVLIGLIIVGFFIYSSYNQPATVVSKPTRTFGPSPTFTSTPTLIHLTPKPQTPNPLATRQIKPLPLHLQLTATYTATPLYVNTPRVVNEAYTLGLRALSQSDFETARINFEQALQMEPNAPDIHYYIGETYRLQSKYQAALDAYKQALEVDQDFAPAYLGQARCIMILRPGDNVSKIIQTAIDKDPHFGEAYLEMAKYLIDKGDFEAASEYLLNAEQLLPGSPLVYLYQAQAYMQSGENMKALEYARKSNRADITLLKSYLILAEAAYLNNEYQEAIDAIKTFLLYEKEDANAWLIQGQALYATGQYTETITALSQALNLSSNLAAAFRVRGLAYVELGEGQKAVNDIFQAMQLETDSFELELGMGRGLYLIDRLADAQPYMNRALNMAETDQQKAQVYFWRAQLYKAAGNLPAALKDWQALLDLPQDAMPAEWRALATVHLKAAATPGATTSPTPSLTPRSGSSATPTPTPTNTPIPGSSATPTPTPTNS